MSCAVCRFLAATQKQQEEMGQQASMLRAAQEEAMLLRGRAERAEQALVSSEKAIRGSEEVMLRP